MNKTAIQEYEKKGTKAQIRLSWPENKEIAESLSALMDVISRHI
jgi:hypothetical protein